MMSEFDQFIGVVCIFLVIAAFAYTTHEDD